MENSKKRKERETVVKSGWVRKGSHLRSQRYPSIIVYLLPETHSKTSQNLEEQYVALTQHNNNSCVEKPMPLLKYICCRNTPQPHKTYSLNSPRKLDFSEFDFHGDTSNSSEVRWRNIPYFDETPGAYRDKYATIALDELNSWKTWIPSTYKGDLALVECGPIMFAHSSSGLILHFNFKARNIDVTGAPVETCFTELIKSNENDVQPVCITCLGPSSSLPDKAETFGCLYCSSYNIHHPGNPLLPGFHNGREDHGTTLESQTQKLREFTRKCKIEGITCMFSHPGLKYFGRYDRAAPTTLATVALSLFNSRTKATNFKLVKLGSSARRHTSLGFLVHLNFEAKNILDPGAPLQTFFAEVIRCSFYVFATFCECLGPSDFVLLEEPKKHGCTFCVRARVHHPPGPGYLNGREYEEL